MDKELICDSVQPKNSVSEFLLIFPIAAKRVFHNVSLLTMRIINLFLFILSLQQSF